MHRTIRQLLMATTIVTTCMMAHAQPLPNGGNNGRGQGGGFNWQNMKPEERMGMIIGFMEQGLRQQLTQDGVTKELQEPIIKAWRDQEMARQDIRTKTGELSDALGKNGATKEELGIMLRDLRDAVAQEKIRHDQSLKDLDAKIGYTKDVQLEALLTVLGVLGDEASYANISGLMSMMMGRNGIGMRPNGGNGPRPPTPAPGN